MLAGAVQALAQAPSWPDEPVDRAFLGRYQASFPARAGESAGLQVRVHCQPEAGCLVNFGASSEFFDAIRVFPDRQIHQARFALKYARDRKTLAAAARPDLEPLLGSSAQVDSCLDLDRAVDRMMQPAPYPGGYTLLCRLDGEPWPRRALLLMVTLPAACGQAFCRYEIVPVFR